MMLLSLLITMEAYMVQKIEIEKQELKKTTSKKIDPSRLSKYR